MAVEKRHVQQRLSGKASRGREHEVYDKDSGEVMEGALVFVPKRPRSPFGRDWFAVAQDAMMFLAQNRKALGEEGLAVFCALGARLDFQNWIAVSPTEVAKEIGMARPNVSRAVRRLLDLGIIRQGPTSGRVRTYQLNPSIGWKGTAQTHFTALQEARAKGWTVVSGGPAPGAIEASQEPEKDARKQTNDLPFPT